MSFISRAHYENPDESQRARLLINGEEVKKGTVEHMKDAYRVQVGMDQKCNVAVQQWQKKPLSGKPAGYVTILSRSVRAC